MINLRFSLSNPWWNRFENVYSNAGETPFENKFWEIQLLKSDDILSFDLRVTTRCDHAGVDLWIGLLGYSVNLNFYDNRHWNSEKGAWEVYD